MLSLSKHEIKPCGVGISEQGAASIILGYDPVLAPAPQASRAVYQAVTRRRKRSPIPGEL
jgi:hypothetical protein